MLGNRGRVCAVGLAENRRILSKRVVDSPKCTHNFSHSDFVLRGGGLNKRNVNYDVGVT